MQAKKIRIDRLKERKMKDLSLLKKLEEYDIETRILGRAYGL